MTTSTPPIKHWRPLQRLVDDECDDETPSFPTLARIAEGECDDEIEAEMNCDHAIKGDLQTYDHMHTTNPTNPTLAITVANSRRRM